MSQLAPKTQKYPQYMAALPIRLRPAIEAQAALEKRSRSNWVATVVEEKLVQLGRLEASHASTGGGE